MGSLNELARKNANGAIEPANVVARILADAVSNAQTVMQLVGVTIDD